MKKTVITALLILNSALAFSQSSLFGFDSSIKAHSGFILNGNASFDVPMATMSKRFGVDYRLGPGISYKTMSNWIFGVKVDFLAGNLVKEDSFMINIKDKYSGKFNGKGVEIINSSGQRAGLPVYERGYLIGVTIGHIFNRNPEHPDNGWTLLTTAGFIQHKITIYDKDVNIPQVDFGYKKGYDRLTNGWFVEQYLGYTFFARNKLLNFNLGLDAVFGFTRGRRDYLYDVMRADNAQRYDFLLGLKGGWMIPIFKRRSEDISFE